LPLFVKETTRLLAERKRQERPDLDRVQKDLTKVEMETTHLLTAIKQGIFTASTKAELERVEAERDRLRDRLQDGVQKLDKVVARLPRVRERYEAVLNNLAHVPPRHIVPMREQIRDLVRKITLRPTPGGYLEAEMIGRCEGLLNWRSARS
jgi:site-specific DNA recombinase